MKSATLSIGTAALLLLGTQAIAQSTEEAAAACKEAARQIEENDLVGAMDEAQWCVESLQQLRQQVTLTLFPDSVDDFEGGVIDNQNAMGMNIIERRYTKDDGEFVVSLTTGVAGGGLAALAQLGLGIGNGTGKKIRIQKRTVLDMSEVGGETKYMVQLKSGGMLNFSSSKMSNEQLLSYVKSFPIEELDDALEP